MVLGGVGAIVTNSASKATGYAIQGEQKPEEIEAGGSRKKKHAAKLLSEGVDIEVIQERVTRPPFFGQAHVGWSMGAYRTTISVAPRAKATPDPYGAPSKGSQGSLESPDYKVFPRAI